VDTYDRYNACKTNTSRSAFLRTVSIEGLEAIHNGIIYSFQENMEEARRLLAAASETHPTGEDL
jgi:hypothetical protein